MICQNSNYFVERLLVFIVILVFSTLLLSAETDNNFLITPQKAKQLLNTNTTVVLLDVRTAEEFSQGHIKKAILLPYDTINQKTISTYIPTLDTTIIVYCRSGRRSNIALKTLHTLGYKNVFDLGGITSWPYEIEQ